MKKVYSRVVYTEPSTQGNAPSLTSASTYRSTWATVKHWPVTSEPFHDTWPQLCNLLGVLVPCTQPPRGTRALYPASSGYSYLAPSLLGVLVPCTQPPRGTRILYLSLSHDLIITLKTISRWHKNYLGRTNRNPTRHNHINKSKLHFERLTCPSKLLYSIITTPSVMVKITRYHCILSSSNECPWWYELWTFHVKRLVPLK